MDITRHIAVNKPIIVWYTANNRFQPANESMTLVLYCYDSFMFLNYILTSLKITYKIYLDLMRHIHRQTHIHTLAHTHMEAQNSSLAAMLDNRLILTSATYCSSCHLHLLKYTDMFKCHLAYILYLHFFMLNEGAPTASGTSRRTWQSYDMRMSTDNCQPVNLWFLTVLQWLSCHYN